ncbi:nucleotidyl transferase AbiEii/AbiGii toxin family protein [Burkholderia stagnalis]|uniref:nucleotidyl transferase AbiEii/AbiGii toxin family protein n=1 Tax=Burkholderia stagnalis TaxID=1503054 RepID=UPI000F58B2B7|nr:nucleotidyl transferase AbiEii/AbiGii toxin family protein [Burkholderia stagnalis]RQR11324.1 nucleotidyl transferase AbiEii/AbiGii toxin family protein [Burkholderia stagnalis]RQR20351.1 nucleotidyl transferase AbiEii/AbiGii toxin family protein [Burkholderia stagnalis]
MQRTQTDLLTLAGQYANERKVSASTVVKEILHYEILYALVQSGAAGQLTFQGGTALRLCYQGTRYSEDLDFAGGQEFRPESMAPFGDVLQKEIGAAYGLQVEIKPPKDKEPEEGIAVARWSAKVHVPQVDRTVQQKQVINIEVASVPAHDVDLVPVAANYPHLPAVLRQMLITAETPKEILADKIVALGARPFLKARDIWDIKFLTDRQIAPDMDLVARKLTDYGWDQDDFKQKLEAKLIQLDDPATAQAFQHEMTRFVDSTVAAQLENKALTAMFLRRSKELGQTVLRTDLDIDDAPRMRP